MRLEIYNLASHQGYDPCTSVLETDVLPITPVRYKFGSGPWFLTKNGWRISPVPIVKGTVRNCLVEEQGLEPCLCDCKSQA